MFLHYQYVPLAWLFRICRAAKPSEIGIDKEAYVLQRIA